MSSDASSFISLSTFTPLTQFAMTSTSIVLNVVSGILSTLSSLVILNIIRLSSQKLTTTYHRIMTFMSVFDIMASVSMALTTLPMPSDDMLRFAGPMLGNKTTCQTQGYFLLMGLTGGGALYVCLSWYFVCKVTLKMDSEKIRKIIEPIYYIYSICFALFLPSYNLFKNAIDTVPKSSFCIIGPTHSHCDNSIDENFLVCDEDTLQKLQGTLTIVKACVGFNVFMIVVAMVIIIRTILKKNRSIKRDALEPTSITDPLSLPTSVDNNIVDSNSSDLMFSLVLVIQALMYILAYLVTWLFMIIPMVMNLDQNADQILLAFKAVFFPLQGFWNLIIFVYDKAYLVYQKEQEKGYWNAIKIVVFHPAAIPAIIIPPFIIGIDDGNQMEEAAQNMDVEIPDDRDTKPSKHSRDVDNFEFNSKSSISSFVSSFLTVNNEKDNSEVEYLGNDENQRFYRNTNGLRRTGKVEDRQEGRNVVNSSTSIESPVGFISDSNDDDSGTSRSMGLSLYHLNDIMENEEKEEDKEEEEESDRGPN